MAAASIGQLAARPIGCFEENKVLSRFVGYSLSNDTSYAAYRAFIFLFYTYIHVSSIYTLYLVSSDKTLTADVIHLYSVSVWHFWCLGGRLATERSLIKMRDMIYAGIFVYEQEELDEDQVRMLKGIETDIMNKSKRLISIYVFGMFSAMIAFPLTEYIMNRDNPREKEHMINPFLPHPSYYPFNTKTMTGFGTAYMIDFIYWIYVYATAVVNNGLIISSTVHLRVHFSLLNHSVMNIQRRACSLYAKHGTGRLQSLDQLLKDKLFLKCLNSCLHSNIKHHQALIRFKKICQPFNGLSLLNTFTVTVVIYAAMLYLLLQNIPLTMKIKYAGTFIAEQAYAFYICNFGQEVTTESDTLFEALYSTPWIHYEKDFKQSLQIMLTNTRNPMQIKAFLLDFSATLNSYSVLLSAIYKVMSLWRQSDRVKS